MASGIFWLVAGAMALGVALILWRALRRGTMAVEAPAALDARVYRDQLRELERDRARGTVAADEAERLRAEVARRLLEADRTACAATAPKLETPGRVAGTLGAAALVLAIAGAGALYALLGRPDMPDEPIKARIAAAEAMRADRPSQAAMEASLPAAPPPAPDPEFEPLMKELRSKLAERPNDLKGHQLLARNEAKLGNLSAAWMAQARVVAILGNDATERDRLLQATLMVQAAGGRVSPEAERLLADIARANPSSDTALFFLGIDNLQVGRYDLAFADWRKLLETAPDASPWREDVRARIADLAELAGVHYEVPPAPVAIALPGPDADAVADAANMSPEARTTMIQGMVAQLGDRLATSGGTAAEWARLIQALGVLGETDRATAIWTEAKATFATSPGDLTTLAAAANAAGIAQ